MSLGIFSFDLAALIRSLENCFHAGETENGTLDSTLEKIESARENAAVTAVEEVVIAAALNSAVRSVLAATEKAPQAKPVPKKTPFRATAAGLGEETRKEIERLIKSLQASVIHNYKASDIIDEAISLNGCANFPKRTGRENSERKIEAIENDRRREERRLKMLRDELQKAVFRNNTCV